MEDQNDISNARPTSTASIKSIKKEARQSVFQYRANKIGWLGSRLDMPDGDDVLKFDEAYEADEADEADTKSIRKSVRASTIQPDSKPTFRKRQSSSILELFYDLWVVATLNIFSSDHDITERAELGSYIEFMFLLWTTWFLVAIYDVRFLEDSVIERITRAVHLGVLLVFVRVSPFFDPEDQTPGVFASLSLALMFSRLMLAFQYGTVLWQIRVYKHGRRPVMWIFAIHAVAAVIYGCLTAAFFTQKNSLAYRGWLVLSTFEIVANLVVSMPHKVISFEGSHLPERLNQLTLIVLGEGIINLARDMATIEKNSGHSSVSWSPAMWAVFLSGIGIVYIVFQIYFDWMHPNRMASWPQVAWALLHPPFHFALLLVMEAMNQFIIWWRLLEIVADTSTSIFNSTSSWSSSLVPTSAEVATKLNDTVQNYLATYPAQEDQMLIWDGVTELLNNISSLPQELWQVMASRQSGNNTLSQVDQSFVSNGSYAASLSQFQEDQRGLFSAVMDSVFSNFELDPFEDGSVSSKDAAVAQREATAVIARIFDLVFVYAFISAGVMIILLVLIHAVSKRQGWTPFNILRSSFIATLGLGLMLVTVLATDLASLDAFFGTPWPLPTMGLTFALVLVLTHVPHPKVFLGYEAPVEDLGIDEGSYGSYEWTSKYYNSAIPRSKTLQKAYESELPRETGKREGGS